MPFFEILKYFQVMWKKELFLVTSETFKISTMICVYEIMWKRMIFFFKIPYFPQIYIDCFLFYIIENGPCIYNICIYYVISPMLNFLWYINIYLVHKTELMFYTHCKYNCYDPRLSTKQFPESYSTAAIMKRAVENNYYIIVPNTM